MKAGSPREICTSMSTVTLFITAETMDTTQVPIDRWMDKLSMVYTHNGGII